MTYKDAIPSSRTPAEHDCRDSIVAFIQTRNGLERNDAASATDAVFEFLVTAVLKHGEIRVDGFGTFTVATRNTACATQSRKFHRPGKIYTLHFNPDEEVVSLLNW